MLSYFWGEFTGQNEDPYYLLSNLFRNQKNLQIPDLYGYVKKDAARTFRILVDVLGYHQFPSLEKIKIVFSKTLSRDEAEIIAQEWSENKTHIIHLQVSLLKSFFPYLTQDIIPPAGTETDFNEKKRIFLTTVIDGPMPSQMMRAFRLSESAHTHAVMKQHEERYQWEIGHLISVLDSSSNKMQSMAMRLYMISNKHQKADSEPELDLPTVLKMGARLIKHAALMSPHSNPKIKSWVNILFDWAKATGQLPAINQLVTELRIPRFIVDYVEESNRIDFRQRPVPFRDFLIAQTLNLLDAPHRLPSLPTKYRFNNYESLLPDKVRQVIEHELSRDELGREDLVFFIYACSILLTSSKDEIHIHKWATLTLPLSEKQGEFERCLLLLNNLKAGIESSPNTKSLMRAFLCLAALDKFSHFKINSENKKSIFYFSYTFIPIEKLFPNYQAVYQSTGPLESEILSNFTKANDGRHLLVLFSWEILLKNALPDNALKTRMQSLLTLLTSLTDEKQYQLISALNQIFSMYVKSFTFDKMSEALHLLGLKWECPENARAGEYFKIGTSILENLQLESKTIDFLHALLTLLEVRRHLILLEDTLQEELFSRITDTSMAEREIFVQELGLATSQVDLTNQNSRQEMIKQGYCTHYSSFITHLVKDVPKPNTQRQLFDLDWLTYEQRKIAYEVVMNDNSALFRTYVHHLERFQIELIKVIEELIGGKKIPLSTCVLLLFFCPFSLPIMGSFNTSLFIRHNESLVVKHLYAIDRARQKIMTLQAQTQTFNAFIPANYTHKRGFIADLFLHHEGRTLNSHLLEHLSFLCKELLSTMLPSLSFYKEMCDSVKDLFVYNEDALTLIKLGRQVLFTNRNKTDLFSTSDYLTAEGKDFFSLLKGTPPKTKQIFLLAGSSLFSNALEHIFIEAGKELFTAKGIEVFSHEETRLFTRNNGRLAIAPYGKQTLFKTETKALFTDEGLAFLFSEDGINTFFHEDLNHIGADLDKIEADPSTEEVDQLAFFKKFKSYFKSKELLLFDKLGFGQTLFLEIGKELCLTQEGKLFFAKVETIRKYKNTSLEKHLDPVPLEDHRGDPQLPSPIQLGNFSTSNVVMNWKQITSQQGSFPKIEILLVRHLSSHIESRLLTPPPLEFPIEQLNFALFEVFERELELYEKDLVDETQSEIHPSFDVQFEQYDQGYCQHMRSFFEEKLLEFAQSKVPGKFDKIETIDASLVEEFSHFRKEVFKFTANLKACLRTAQLSYFNHLSSHPAQFKPVNMASQGNILFFKGGYSLVATATSVPSLGILFEDYLKITERLAQILQEPGRATYQVTNCCQLSVQTEEDLNSLTRSYPVSLNFEASPIKKFDKTVHQHMITLTLHSPQSIFFSYKWENNLHDVNMPTHLCWQLAMLKSLYYRQLVSKERHEENLWLTGPRPPA